MNITKEQIKALNPCAKGYKWFLEKGSADLKTTLLDVDKHRPDWARWLFTNLMDVTQKRRVAVFAANQVLSIFEKKYPDDKRPRNAIDAAKTVMENDTPENRASAASAANAAYAANAAAAAYAVAAAAHAAHAAAAAAHAEAAAARKEMQERIILEAVRILDGGEGNE